MTGPAHAPWRRPLALLAAALAVLTLWRLAVVIATPLNLGPDEAQYWSWSLAPALGYFSKPPLIAWLIGLSTSICGDTAACIRASAPLLHAATALTVFLAARTLYDERTGLWAALTYASMPGTSFSSLLMTTDVPLLFFWALALLALAMLRKTSSTPWAVALGAAIGFGLLSKYAMLYFALGLALTLLFDRDSRSLLFGRNGLIAAAVALAVFAPNLIWNALNGFVTASHTLANANWSSASLFNAAKLGEFLAAQLGIAGPIAAGLFVWGLLRGWRQNDAAAADTLLVSLTLPILVVVATQAFISRANANWAAPAFVALSILVAAWGVRGRLGVWLAANAALNLLAAIALGVLALSPAVVAAVGQDNAVKRLRGWTEAGSAVANIAGAGDFAAVLSDDREDMASLFYYARPRRQPLRMWPRESAGNEYEVSHRLRPEETRSVLFVTRRSEARDVVGAFSSSERIATLETRLDSKRRRIFYLYALKGPVDSSRFRNFFNRPSTD